jgi:hypothetical protein
LGLHTGARRLTPREWDELSTAVFERDGWTCLAPQLDPEAGPCHDQSGRWFVTEEMRLNSFRPGRLIYVRRFLTLQHVQILGRTDNDLRFLLSLCWGHHLGNGEKGGRIWSKQKKAAEAQRRYLIDHYPEIAA